MGALILQDPKLRSKLRSSLVDRPSIERTMEGASTVTINVHDPDEDLLQSPILTRRPTLKLDELDFRFTKATSPGGDQLDLLFEDREVARMRGQEGPRKAFRDKLTRAEFVAQLFREADVPLFVPELHVTQPIESARQARAGLADKETRREPGLDGGSDVKVKGAGATPEQLKVIDRVLDVGMSLRANERVLVASVMTITQEATAKNLSYGDVSGYLGAFQQHSSWPGDARDIENAATNFFKRAPTFPGGAIAYERSHPDASLGEICQAIQRSAHPTLYSKWESEARKTVSEYLGGGASGSMDVTVEKRYAFEQGRNEDSWTCTGRLGEEVNFRRFVSTGLGYYVSEPYLLRSKVRMRVYDGARGIDRISFDYDMGKPVGEVRVTGRAREWAAPPGSVAFVRGKGPADGRYLVSTIRGVVGSSGVEIVLKRPTPPLPEPAPETEEKSISFGGKHASGGGAARSMIRWVESQLGTREGSAAQVRYASELGLSASLPWCSIFLGYGLKTQTKVPLPGNPAYSGAWLNWSGGKRVSLGEIKPGDFVVFDWGDGGITDHVAMYAGNGQVIGGNQSNAVTKVPLNRGAVVGVARPNY